MSRSSLVCLISLFLAMPLLAAAPPTPERTLSVEELVQLHAYNVSADYIRQLKAAGYRPLTVDRIIELKQHGINPSE